MNSNVVNAYIGGTGRNTILSQTLATATETEFKIGTDSGSTTTIAVLSVPTQNQILGSQTPLDISTNFAQLNGGFSRIGIDGGQLTPYPSQTFDSGRPFLVRVCGTAAAVSNAANGFAASLRLGTTVAGTLVAVNTASVANASTVAYNFVLEAYLQWNSTSQRVTGYQWGSVDGTTAGFKAPAVLSTATISAAAVANLQFVACATWSNAVGGTASVSEFSLTQL